MCDIGVQCNIREKECTVPEEISSEEISFEEEEEEADFDDKEVSFIEPPSPDISE